MEAEEVLYRALGVSGLIGPPNRPQAAAARLCEKIPTLGGDVKVEAAAWSNGLGEICEEALWVVKEAQAQGALDPIIGQFAGSERVRERIEAKLVDSATPPGVERVYAIWLPQLIAAAIDAIVELAAQDPSLGWE